VDAKPLGELAAVLPGGAAAAADRAITSVTADSRRVVPGALFVAVRGDAADGHRFIPDALARGAAAIVCEEPPRPAPAGVPCIVVPDSRVALARLAAAWHGFPARQMVMIGVTGTDGKTTTSTLLHAILQAAGLKAGLVSTVGALIGSRELDTGFHVTTPEAVDVQAYLAEMVAAGMTHCVLETTSHGLAQRRVEACAFDVAVVTNVTHEHLDYHKTYENYLAAKGMLFSGLGDSGPKAGGPPESGILNFDDGSYAYLRSVTAGVCHSYSLRGDSGADLHAEAVEHTPQGTRFRVVGAGLDFPVQFALVGDFNVSNCLAAAAAAVLGLGLSPPAVQAGIAVVKGVPGRLERIDLGQRFTAIVDFAHTPNALRRVLQTARQITSGRVLAVFGSAGLRDVEKRRLMAEVSAEMADISVLTAEDPRTESLDAILEMMAAGARSRGGEEGRTFHRIPDRGQAIRLAVGLARPGDLVIVCGKGHEQSMCFGAVEYPWDDRTALRAALADLMGVPGPQPPLLPTSSLPAL
jgi:UDP-N-acetylmuramoyl-L-alanyl-D-glutamate--2,6-diaminopimelate ligase